MNLRLSANARRLLSVAPIVALLLLMGGYAIGKQLGARDDARTLQPAG